LGGRFSGDLVVIVVIDRSKSLWFILVDPPESSKVRKLPYFAIPRWYVEHK
jgi:hypothetical protein